MVTLLFLLMSLVVAVMIGFNRYRLRYVRYVGIPTKERRLKNEDVEMALGAISISFFILASAEFGAILFHSINGCPRLLSNTICLIVFSMLTVACYQVLLLVVKKATRCSINLNDRRINSIRKGRRAREEIDRLRRNLTEFAKSDSEEVDRYGQLEGEEE